MPKINRTDIQARVGFWLYHHGWPRLGNWLFIRSQHWRRYVSEQYR